MWKASRLIYRSTWQGGNYHQGFQGTTQSLVRWSSTHHLSRSSSLSLQNPSLLERSLNTPFDIEKNVFHNPRRRYARAKATSGPPGKGIPHKPDSLSIIGRIKAFNPFTAPLDWNAPRIGPNLRELNYEQWKNIKGDSKLLTMARFHRIFPDTLSHPFLPLANLVVDFGEEGSGTTLANDFLVYRGNFLRPKDVLERPRVKFDCAPGFENTTWTLMMIDPDAPSRADPTFRHWQHWIVSNIPADRNVKLGEEIVEYVGAAPPRYTEDHRYVFLLCAQSEPVILDPDEQAKLNNVASRGGFNVTRFLQDHKLKPVSYCFFQATWDESVPETYKKLGLEEPQYESPEERADRLRKERKLEKHAKTDGDKYKVF